VLPEQFFIKKQEQLLHNNLACSMLLLAARVPTTVLERSMELIGEALQSLYKWRSDPDGGSGFINMGAAQLLISPLCFICR
jgi:hypothetical protein